MMMADRFRYAEVRQMIIDAMKVDLMGPQSEDEVLDENPRHAYIIGLLAPQSEAGIDAAGETISPPERTMIMSLLSPHTSNCQVLLASAFTSRPGPILSVWMSVGATIQKQPKSVRTKTVKNVITPLICVIR